MSQVKSSYERKEHELYPTPSWVTWALLTNVEFPGGAWECAAGEGQMADVLDNIPEHAAVFRSDARSCKGLHWTGDFLKTDRAYRKNIVTNPPFGKGGKLAESFIEHALDLTASRFGKVAMLLRIDFDSAKTRRRLFQDGNCSAFARKIVLLDRIKWFDGPAGPSENHAWYVWDWTHVGPATIHYVSKAEAEVTRIATSIGMSKLATAQVAA